MSARLYRSTVQTVEGRSVCVEYGRIITAAATESAAMLRGLDATIEHRFDGVLRGGRLVENEPTASLEIQHCAIEQWHSGSVVLDPLCDCNGRATAKR